MREEQWFDTMEIIIHISTGDKHASKNKALFAIFRHC